MTADYPARRGSVAAGTTPDNPAGMLSFSSNGELSAVRSKCEAIQNVSLITEPAIVPQRCSRHCGSEYITRAAWRTCLQCAQWRGTRGRPRSRRAEHRRLFIGISATDYQLRTFRCIKTRFVDQCLSRRMFLGGSLAGSGGRLASGSAGGIRPDQRLAFAADGNQYRFDTGTLRGAGADGRSVGMLSLEEVSSGLSLAHSLGVFSHYRLLAPGHRFGPAAWDWGSSAELQDDGSVRASWSHDDIHPFDLTAVYRWIAPDTLDLSTQITARKDLQHFESFLACYFNGFGRAYALVKSSPQKGGQTGFHECSSWRRPGTCIPEIPRRWASSRMGAGSSHPIRSTGRSCPSWLAEWPCAGMRPGTGGACHGPTGGLLRSRDAVR